MSSKFVSGFRNNVLIGLLLIAPIMLTFIVVRWLFNLFSDLFLSFFPKKLWHETDYEFFFRMAALFAVIVVLFFIGLLVRNVLGRRIYRLGDTILGRIPLVNRIYIGLRQVIESLLAQRQTLFQEVVLVEYPRPGVRSIGFVTSVVPPDVVAQIPGSSGNGDYVTVFIPTTPNPTSGWFCVLPRRDTLLLSMSTSDAMKLIVSGGAVYPGTHMNGGQASLLERIEQLAADAPQKPRP